MANTLSSDQIFIGKLREIVETNLSREEFDVEELAREAHMSRSSIHRKLRNLGKLNATHFIREIRLFKARGMLRDGLVTAAEVSYRTGFGSPAYFSKCYHDFYGYPPGEEKRRIYTDGPDQQDTLPGATEFGKHAAAGVNLNRPTQNVKEPLSLIQLILQFIKDLLSYLRYQAFRLRA